MAATIDEYLARLPDDVRARVEEVRRVVHEVVPDAGETISYAMPTFTLDGRPLLHVAAWKEHIGIYPLPPLDPALEALVAPYRGTKDTLARTEAARLRQGARQGSDLRKSFRARQHDSRAQVSRKILT